MARINTRSILPIFCFLLGGVATAFAQNMGAGTDALGSSASGVAKYVPAVQKVGYALAAIVAVVSGVAIYIKMQNNQEFKKHIVAAVGSCLFLIASSAALPAFFGLDVENVATGGTTSGTTTGGGGTGGSTSGGVDIGDIGSGLDTPGTPEYTGPPELDYASMDITYYHDVVQFLRDGEMTHIENPFATIESPSGTIFNPYCPTAPNQFFFMDDEYRPVWAGGNYRQHTFPDPTQEWFDSATPEEQAACIEANKNNWRW